MENKDYNIQELITKWFSGGISAEEKSIVESWFKSFNDESTEVLPDANTVSSEDIKQRIYNRLEGRMFKAGKTKTSKIYYRLSAAAVAIAFVLGFYIKYRIHKERIPGRLVRKVEQTILPGSNKAILTLADGSKIMLDGKNKDTLATQGNMLVKNSNGGIVYIQRSTNNKSGADDLNTISTPRGGQYQLVLADGTKAWLNAQSSITYPIKFDGHIRQVTISGEVYFEVVHNSKMPFRVMSGDQIIEDIGTSFDVKNYSDEDLKTTLVEGAISIGNTTLEPGQQAINRNGLLSIIHVDAEDVIAWKNGYFLFDNADIKEIMKQISRWYNVEVEYQGEIPTLQFGGGIARSSTLQQVLSLLNQSNIHFKIQNRKIIVMP